MAGAAVAFGTAETLTALAPGRTAALALLVVTGYTTLYFTQAVNHRLQLGSAPSHRGRVLALYTLLLQGSTPLGATLTGWIAAHHGTRTALLLGALVSLTAGLAALALDTVNRTSRPSP